MSVQITEAFVKQYRANVMLRYQQRGAKLRGLVREETLVGKQHFFDLIGPTAAVERTTRHSDTPIVDSPHSRRMVTAKRFEWADLIDDADRVQMLIDPTSPYVENAARALGRGYDDVIIKAFDADAFAGEDGTTTVTFASEAAGDLDFSSAALTTTNMLDVKRRLDEKDIPEDERVVVVSPAAVYQLLKQSTAPNASSADYNTIRALVNGEINTWAGFRWVVSTRLPSPATNMRYCYAFHRDAMGVAVRKDITTDIGPRRDKSLSTQVYVCADWGATRIQGEGVVRFKIDETK